MVFSGARQWKHDCRCNENVAEQRRVNKWIRMHSEVSKSNASYFISEDRVGDAVDEDDLLDLLDRHKHIIVCNVCGAIKAIDSDNSGNGGPDPADSEQSSLL